MSGFVESKREAGAGAMGPGRAVALPGSVIARSFARLVRGVVVVALLVFLGACGGEDGATEGPGSAVEAGAASVDCEAFEALRQGEVPEKLPDDPAVFWTAFERCRAGEDATTCERAWTLLRAMPSMANPGPDERGRQKGDYLRACRSLPEPVRRCLTAYALREPDDCEGREAQARLREALRDGD